MKRSFDEIYDAIEPLLEKHVPPFHALRVDGKRCELSSKKNIEYMGKKRTGMFFAAVIKQKNFVGFYLMTIYARPELVQKLGAELRKALKGKSCFHITKIDKTILAQMKKALADGRKLYKKMRWV